VRYQAALHPELSFRQIIARAIAINQAIAKKFPPQPINIGLTQKTRFLTKIITFFENY
jgi:hypothetical protein